MRTLVQFFKLPISALSAVTVAAGHVAFARAISWGVLPACGGALLLACGACALNQVQERDLDALMNRTGGRPIPSGRLSPGTGWIISIAALVAGMGVLLLWTPPMAAILGASAVALYNLAYTPLKRRTAFAVIPGAIVGALPPAIGWSGAGGHPLAPPCLALGLFLYLWQVPHFWLLLSAHGADYERAGLPSIRRVFTGRQLARLSFVWIAACAASASLLPAVGTISSHAAFWGVGLVSLGVIAASWGLLKGGSEGREGTRIFGLLNLYALSVSALVVADPYLARIGGP